MTNWLLGLMAAMSAASAAYLSWVVLSKTSMVFQKSDTSPSPKFLGPIQVWVLTLSVLLVTASSVYIWISNKVSHRRPPSTLQLQVFESDSDLLAKRNMPKVVRAMASSITTENARSIIAITEPFENEYDSFAVELHSRYPLKNVFAFVISQNVPSGQVVTELNTPRTDGTPMALLLPPVKAGDFLVLLASVPVGEVEKYQNSLSLRISN